MNPVVMALLILGGCGLFSRTLAQRYRLLFARDRRKTPIANQIRRRWMRLWVDGLLQNRMRQYPSAGIAHSLMFGGFIILLLRTATLFIRGFVPSFDPWLIVHDSPTSHGLSDTYMAAKDVAAAAVLLAVVFFGVQRLLIRPRRLTLSWEGLLILNMIGVMMIADAVYDGAGLLLARTWAQQCQGPLSPACGSMQPLVGGAGHHLSSVTWRYLPDPLGSLAAVMLQHVSARGLVLLGHLGFWLHVVLVIAFLNWLPYSKHFHIVTALPNLFFSSVEPPGKLGKIAAHAEELLERADALQSSSDADVPPLGLAKIEDLTWKQRLDLFTCTECGRCSEHCPAFLVGKPLSPKQLTLDLRRALLDAEPDLLRGRVTALAAQGGESVATLTRDLVPVIISPETLWSCTTCRACEQQCPVGISYVDKIVDFRRDLVLMRGELPGELQRVFDGIERSGNPWNLPRSDRAAWAAGLGVKRISEVEQVDVLYWVGCAASYDQRAQSVAKALVSLLEAADVSYAILGEQESCTGDAARRAGNEYLFLQLAHKNIELLNDLYQRGKFNRIVTACPHCLTTLSHEYPDFGGNWPVLHHQQLLLDLLEHGRLRPERMLAGLGVLHDPCTLARYASDVISPRALLRKVPGLLHTEAEHNSSQTRCCGAGGARMWLEDAPATRMNEARTKELLATGADRIITSCPFCSTMIHDGVSAISGAQSPQVMDIAQVLAQACGVKVDDVG